jgi:hypothetical protein
MSVEQKPLVQEVIEAAGSHFCTFLPKYHCELNLIEFFWGAVKRYLLRELRLHLGSAEDKLTIRLWEHCIHLGGLLGQVYRLETKEAQLQVREFSSKKYKSDRRVLETVASLFD